MKKFCKTIYAALLDKLATILITFVIGGGMAAAIILKSKTPRNGLVKTWRDTVTA